MKCISLIQPWATLVVLGAKRYETRSWPTFHRGRLAIHASRRMPESARALCEREPFRSILRQSGYRGSADVPRGMILGSVELLDCLPAHIVRDELSLDSPELHFGDFRRGRWAWRLQDAQPFPVPRPYLGRLGVYEIPDPAVEPVLVSA
ncbi:MAG: ASCH domain-containing protein [Gemmataceae bacterium]|nr:ASCH domain-containing protein [Gemmataceae bacterium]